LFTAQLYVTGAGSFDNEIGYGNTDNGILYYAKSSSDFGVRYKNGYGTTTDYPMTISDFDPSKENIFKISILWFGYWGFQAYVYDSAIPGFKLLKQMNFTNTQTLPFIKVPSLPFRIKSSSSEKIGVTCASINVIGGLQTINKYIMSSYSEQLYNNTVSFNTGGYRPILAVRLKKNTASFITKIYSVGVVSTNVFTNAGAGNYVRQLLVYIPFNTTNYVQFVDTTTLNPTTLTWTEFHDNSLVEYHEFINNNIAVRTLNSPFTLTTPILTTLANTGYIILSEDYNTGRINNNILQNILIKVRYDELNDGFNTQSNNGNSSDLFIIFAAGSTNNLQTSSSIIVERN